MDSAPDAEPILILAPAGAGKKLIQDLLYLSSFWINDLLILLLHSY